MKKRKTKTQSPKYRNYTEPLNDHDDSGRPPLKKQKSTNRVDRAQTSDSMEFLGFQTPHPTLESQSQTFKLPSSSPKPSPRPLSPVPGILPAATSSKHFKENALKQDKFSIKPEASSIQWKRHSSNPVASVMRMSGRSPAIPLSRKSCPRSRRHQPFRSQSRSSSNSNSHSNVSSRASSKEPRVRKPKPQIPTENPRLLHKSELKHVHSLSSLDHIKDQQLKHSKKLNQRKSAKPRQDPLSLASPFVSRAPSPVEQTSGTHISTLFQSGDGDLSKRQIVHQHGRKSSTRGILSDIVIDPNLPASTHPLQSAAALQQLQPSRPNYGWQKNVQHSFEQVTAAHTSSNPKKINLTETTARKRLPSAKGLEKFLYVQSQNKPQALGERERRPSAPSSLHLPKELRATGRLSMLGPGRAGGNKGSQLRSQTQEKKGRGDDGPEKTDQQQSSPATASGNAKAASGVHTFHPSIKRGIGGNADIAQAIPPTPVMEMEGFTFVDRKQSSLKPLPQRVPLRPSASLDDLHSGAQSRTHDEYDHHEFIKRDDNDERPAWMYARSGVNFNRPPSQMEVAPSEDIGFGYADFDETFFTSSEEDSASEYADEGDANSSQNKRGRDAKTKPHARRLGEGLVAAFGSVLSDTLELDLDMRVKSGFGFGLQSVGGGRGLGRAFGDGNHDDSEWVQFGEDAWGISTPAKDLPNVQRGKTTARRTLSLPSLHQGGTKGNVTKPESGGVLFKDLSGSREEEDEDGEGDMELTGSATADRTHGREDEDEDDHEGVLSWITDSLISAPTAYLERKRQKAIQIEEGGEDNDKKEEKSSSTLDGPSFRSTFLPAHDVGVDAHHDDDGHDEVGDNHPSESHTHSLSSGTSTKTATRTRSGTIVPANPGGVTIVVTSSIPPGSRRTRSGTIIGPLPAAPPPAFSLPPLPDGSVARVVPFGHARVGAAPIRTRSGTVVASASVPRPGDGGGGGHGGRGRARSGSVVQVKSAGVPLKNGLGAVANTDVDQEQEQDDAVECYTDSLYLPASSPDPIDFLRFAGIAEAEDEEEDMEWHAVREPPSPETQKGKQRGRGTLRVLATRAGKWLTRGKSAASKVGMRKGAKVMLEDDDVFGDAEDSSEDELLLVSGGTIEIWN